MSFDDLRKQSLAVQEQQVAEEPQSLLDRMPLFKDLDPKQRFTVALLLFINVMILGFGCLLVTERMMP